MTQEIVSGIPVFGTLVNAIAIVPDLYRDWPYMLPALSFPACLEAFFL